MASIILMVSAICWMAVVALVWLLCCAARLADEQPARALPGRPSEPRAPSVH